MDDAVTQYGDGRNTLTSPVDAQHSALGYGTDDLHWSEEHGGPFPYTRPVDGIVGDERAFADRLRNMSKSKLRSL